MKLRKRETKALPADAKPSTTTKKTPSIQKYLIADGQKLKKCGPTKVKPTTDPVGPKLSTREKKKQVIGHTIVKDKHQDNLITDHFNNAQSSTGTLLPPKKKVCWASVKYMLEANNKNDDPYEFPNEPVVKKPRKKKNLVQRIKRSDNSVCSGSKTFIAKSTPKQVETTTKNVQQLNFNESFTNLDISPIKAVGPNVILSMIDINLSSIKDKFQSGKNDIQSPIIDKFQGGNKDTQSPINNKFQGGNKDQFQHKSKETQPAIKDKFQDTSKESLMNNTLSPIKGKENVSHSKDNFQDTSKGSLINNTLSPIKVINKENVSQIKDKFQDTSKENLSPTKDKLQSTSKQTPVKEKQNLINNTLSPIKDNNFPERSMIEADLEEELITEDFSYCQDDIIMKQQQASTPDDSRYNSFNEYTTMAADYTVPEHIMPRLFDSPLKISPVKQSPKKVAQPTITMQLRKRKLQMVEVSDQSEDEDSDDEALQVIQNRMKGQVRTPQEKEAYKSWVADMTLQLTECENFELVVE